MWSSSLPVSQPVLQPVTCECVDYRPQWCLMVWELMLAKLCWMFRHNALLNCSRSVELLSLIERRFCLSRAFHWNGHPFKLSWPHHTECFRQPYLWQPYTTGCFAHIHRCTLSDQACSRFCTNFRNGCYVCSDSVNGILNLMWSPVRSPYSFRANRSLFVSHTGAQNPLDRITFLSGTFFQHLKWSFISHFSKEALCCPFWPVWVFF